MMWTPPRPLYLEHLNEAHSEVQVDLVAKVEGEGHEQADGHHAHHVKARCDGVLDLHKPEYLLGKVHEEAGWHVCRAPIRTLQVMKLATLLNAMPEDERASGYSKPSMVMRYLLSRTSPVDTDM